MFAPCSSGGEHTVRTILESSTNRPEPTQNRRQPCPISYPLELDTSLGSGRPAPNQPERHHLRMHSDSKRADKRSIGRQLQQRGGSRQFTAAHTTAHTTRRPMQWLKRRSPRPIRHGVSHGISHSVSRGNSRQSIRHRAPAAHTAQLPSGSRWFKEVPWRPTR